MPTPSLEKKSLEEYTDRELLLTIIGHQVHIYRHLEYLEQFVHYGKIDSLGPDFTASIENLTRDNEQILQDFDKYLKDGSTQHSE